MPGTRQLMRLATAGSVDDGKSTLIGRLLLDSKAIFEDQMEAVHATSQSRGYDYDDLSLFTDMERLVIELADALSDTPSNVDDELYARLSQRFSEQQLIELGAQIAFEQYLARLNRLFDVGSDGLYTPGVTPAGSEPPLE